MYCIRKVFEIDQSKDTVLADLLVVSVHACVNSIVCAVQTRPELDQLNKKS